jgi:6-phosphogluconolactonase
MNKIHTFDSISCAIDWVMVRWHALAHESVLSQGCFRAALSGGTSPIVLYQQLAVQKTLPWLATHLFLVDERWVPVTDANSNYHMIQETLLHALDLSAHQMHRVFTERRMDDAIASYTHDLKNTFHLSSDVIPAFDLIMLGMGGDGHTASLFTPEDCREKNAWVIHTRSPQPPYDRITLTLPVLNQAKNIIFFIQGKNKLTILKEVAERRNLTYPAAHIMPVSGSIDIVFIA